MQSMNYRCKECYTISTLRNENCVSHFEQSHIREMADYTSRCVYESVCVYVLAVVRCRAAALRAARLELSARHGCYHHILS